MATLSWQSIERNIFIPLFYFLRAVDAQACPSFLTVDLSARRIGPSNLRTDRKKTPAFPFSSRETRAPPHLIDKCVEIELQCVAKPCSFIPTIFVP